MSDPKKEILSPAEYYAGLPKKRVSAGVLLFNTKGELLIVKPGYRDFWLVPGGVVEPEESPRGGALREAKEEVGLDLKDVAFASVEFLPKRDYMTESLHFLFDGGTLDNAQIANLVRREGEIDEIRFATVEEALTLLNPFLAKRVVAAIEARKRGGAAYMERGEAR